MSFQVYDDSNPEIMMEQFRNRLKAVQKCLGLRVEDMAAIVGTSRANYQKYLSGDIKLPIDRMLVLTRELKIDGNYLLAGDATSGMFRKVSASQNYACEISLLNIKAFLDVSVDKMTDRDKIKIFRLLMQVGNQI